MPAGFFRQWPKVFDQLSVAMVEAGEAGGVLDEALKRLAKLLEDTHHNRLIDQAEERLNELDDEIALILLALRRLNSDDEAERADAEEELTLLLEVEGGAP